MSTASPQPSISPSAGTTVDVSQAELTLIYLLCTGMSIVLCVMCLLCGRRPRRFTHRAQEEDPFACVCRPVVVTRKARDDEIQEAKACPICLEPLCATDEEEDEGVEDTGGGAVVADCGHPLHANCLAQWLLKDVRVTCPVCRAPYQVAATTVTVAADEPGGERTVQVREPGGVQTVIAFSDEAARDEAVRNGAPEDSEEASASAEEPTNVADNVDTEPSSHDADQAGNCDADKESANESNTANGDRTQTISSPGFENVVLTGIVAGSRT